MGPLAHSNQKQIADLAAKNRLPAIYERGDFVDSGGLMSYGPDRANPTGAQPLSSTKFLKEQSQPTFPSSNRRSSSSSSI